MATLHITDAELARDVRAVLDKVREGMEIGAAVASSTRPQDIGSACADAQKLHCHDG
jgi:hypothetical protein